MKKISSATTTFRKSILPIILIFSVLLVFVLLVFVLINWFDYTFKDLGFLIFPTIIFGFAWVIIFRKLQVVYLGERFLKVDEKKILFEDILAVDKKDYFRYKVTYQLNDEISSFVFMVDCLPFLTPSFVKEIRGSIKK